MDTARDDIVEEEDIFGPVIAPLSPLGPVHLPDEPPASSSQGAKEKAEHEDSRPVKRKPRPCLNEDRLCDKKGIFALPKVFEGINFLGRGHEKENLTFLLSKYEHWAQMMYPKSQFIDVVDKVEYISSRKRVRDVAQAVKRGELFLDDVVDEQDDVVAYALDAPTINPAQNEPVTNQNSRSQINDEDEILFDDEDAFAAFDLNDGNNL